MTWLDIIILLPLLIGLVRGLMRGVVTEVFAIVAVIVGFIGARVWGHTFATWIIAQFTWPEPVCNVISYSLIFIAIALLCNLLARLLSKLLKAIHLGFANRLCGGLVGIIKWGFIVLAIVFCLGQLDSKFHFLSRTLIQQSIVYTTALDQANQAWNYIQTEPIKSIKE